MKLARLLFFVLLVPTSALATLSTSIRDREYLKFKEVGGEVTVQVSEPFTSVGSNQAKSNTNCSALTGSYATQLTPAFDVCIMHVFNGCDGTWLLSIDGGTTAYMDLAAGESVVDDFCSNKRYLPSGVAIKAKQGTSAPTSGTLRISVEG